MERRKREFALPDWFDLDSYKAAAKMDAADWYINLRVREVAGRLNDVVLLGNVRRHPIFRRDMGAQSFFQGLMLSRGPAWVYVHDVWDTGALRKPIWEASPGDLYAIESHLSSSDQAMGRAVFGTPLDDSSTPPLTPDTQVIDGRKVFPVGDSGGTLPELPNWFFEPINSRLDTPWLAPMVRVDLSSPPEVLERAFKAWVKSAQQRMKDQAPSAPWIKGTAKRNERSLNAFAVCGLLPYLDLDQWRKGAGMKLRDASIAAAIEVDSGQLKDKTKVWASRLMNSYALDGLFSRWL